MAGGTDLKSGGNVNILAYDNANQAGNQDTSRPASASATASGGGVSRLGGGRNRRERRLAAPPPMIGAGANVAAGNNLAVNALTFNQSGGNLNATAGGVVNAGSANGTHRHDQPDVAGSRRRRRGLAHNLPGAGNLIRVFSNNSDSGNASVKGSGGGVDRRRRRSRMYLDEPARSGPMTGPGWATTPRSTPPALPCRCCAKNQNNLSAGVSQQTIGGIESNTGEGDAVAAGRTICRPWPRSATMPT